MVVALALAGAMLGCANLGEYVWVKDYRDTRPAPAAGGYVLGPGDTIAVGVFGQEAMSARGRIRADGKISMPFLNDVQAAGYTPPVLAKQLEVRLKEFLVNKAVVTVVVEEQRKIEVPVVGDVTRQGLLAMPADVGVLEALAAAGGLTEMAHRDRIFVVRYQDPRPTRIRFTYEELLQARPPASTFRLSPGDQIVVE